MSTAVDGGGEVDEPYTQAVRRCRIRWRERALEWRWEIYLVSTDERLGKEVAWWVALVERNT